MENKKRCPYCGEEIMAVARKCRYCGEWLNDDVEQKMRSETTSFKEDLIEKITKDSSKKIEQNKPHDSLFRSCFWEQLSKHYCDFKGRVDRKTFWIFYLFYALLSFLMMGVSQIAPLIGVVMQFVIWFGLFLPCLGLCVRRLHDIGKKWTWILIVLVPIIGPIWLICLMAEKGVLLNVKKWTMKDTAITIAMIVAALGLVIAAAFSNDKEKCKECFSPSEEAYIRDQIRNIQNEVNVNNVPISDFFDDHLKSMYDSVIIIEQTVGFDCECLDIIRQIESDHVVIAPIECYEFIEGEASVVADISFAHYPKQEVTLFLTIERGSYLSFKQKIKRVLINGLVMGDGRHLFRCMKDWFFVISELEDNSDSERDEDSIKDEVERRAVEAYESCSFHDYMTLAFKEAEKATLLEMDNDFIPPFSIESFYSAYTCSDTAEVNEIEMLDRHEAIVNMKLVDWYDIGVCAERNVVLYMVYDRYLLNWLIDDVLDEGFSYKNAMIEFVDSCSEKCVIIDKWPDSMGRRLNVGDKYRFLGEMDGFYNIDFYGEHLWVPKDFVHIEKED